MSRKLVHVERVVSIEPIENADKIEVVTVLGWHVVARKGEFKPGELVMYFEIDSFLPIEPRYEFLRASSYKTMDIEDEENDELVKTIEGFCLRTIKMRGQISQGLVLPLALFEKELRERFTFSVDTDGFTTNVEPGTDFTDILGVQLYEPPVPKDMRSATKGHIPRNIKRTDQERIQNHPEYFEKYRDVEFEVTEKIDGTSVTVFVDDKNELNVCGRRYNIKKGDNIYWNAVNDTILHDAFDGNGRKIAVQLELAGEGINGSNKNPLAIKGRRLFAFDAWDIEKQRYLTPTERKLFLRGVVFETISLTHVPIIYSSFKPFTVYKNTDELIASARGKSLVNPGREREGLVFKSRELIDGNVLSFKVIDNRLLLMTTSSKGTRVP